MSRASDGTVIDLFSHKASNKRLTTRIDSIVAAVIKNGRLYIELGLTGPEPPRTWLAGLTCIVKNGPAGTAFSVSVECATQRDGDQFLVRTVPLPPGMTDGYLPVGSIMTISNSNGIVCVRTFDTRSDKPSA